MEQNRRTGNHPRKRKRTKAAKMAYLRAAGVGMAMVTVVGISAYGFTRFLHGRADAAEPAGTSTVQSNQVDSYASATVQPLSGSQLSGLLDIRIQQLNYKATQPVDIVTEAPTTPAATDANATSDAAAKSTTTAAASTVPTVFDASAMGASGFSNISAWKQKNSDVRGWLRIPNTNINYPVVVGPDNLYYGSLGYDKQYSKNGVIWADSDTKFGTRDKISQNNVIYGHNWTNYTANPAIARSSDVMFGQLTSFHHLSFAKVTPYIYYSTAEEEMTWKVFAVFYTEEGFNYITSDPGAEGLQAIIDEARLRSVHKYDVDVNSSDKIITLSTCTRAYGKTSEQRFVVMARLMRPGEEITEVTITENVGHKEPKI